MANNNQQHPQYKGYREAFGAGEGDRNHTTFRNSVFHVLLAIYMLNVINVALYNTHWVQLEKGNGFDIGVAVFMFAVNLFGIISLGIFRK